MCGGGGGEVVLFVDCLNCAFEAAKEGLGAGEKGD